MERLRKCKWLNAGRGRRVPLCGQRGQAPAVAGRAAHGGPPVRRPVLCLVADVQAYAPAHAGHDGPSGMVERSVGVPVPTPCLLVSRVCYICQTNYEDLHRANATAGTLHASLARSQAVWHNHPITPRLTSAPHDTGLHAACKRSARPDRMCYACARAMGAGADLKSFDVDNKYGKKVGSCAASACGLPGCQ